MLACSSGQTNVEHANVVQECDTDSAIAMLAVELCMLEAFQVLFTLQVVAPRHASVARHAL